MSPQTATEPRARSLAIALMMVLLMAPQASAQESHQDHDQSDAFWAALARNHSGRYAIAAGPLKAASPAQLTELGTWSSVIEWPHIPVSAANLPDGRVITWASNLKDGFPAGPEYTFSSVWNPETNNFVETPNHTHDMFCSHMVMLPDGRLLVNGGRNHVKTTSIFDFTSNTWSQDFSMNHGRWYPTSVALPNGRVFTASGSGQPNAAGTAEIWIDGSGWFELGNVDWDPIASSNGFESHWWPHVYVDPRGDLFHAGPTEDMHRVTTSASGSITNLGPWLNDGWYSKHAAVTMYDEGLILIAGGATEFNADPSTNRAIIIDINGTTPVVTEIAPMQYARRFASAIMLPTGEVLVVGGNTSGFKFSDEGTVLPAEIWNPQTGAWRTVASISEPRNYHSIALLLESGKVLSAGGGLCGGGCAANHQDGQVYTPGYLFNAAGNEAARPEIVAAPSAVGYGQNFLVEASGDVAYFSLIKASATTHAVNTDQRYLRMDIAGQTGNQYSLTSHDNINVLTPGYWMMFAVDAAGVPSEAHWLLASPDLTLSILAVGDQVSQEGDLVSLPIDHFVPPGMQASFSAAGLPPGLGIDTSSGVISGTVAAGSAGLYAVTVTLEADAITDQVSFNWSVRDGGTGQILREWWSNVGGDLLEDLTSDPRYPNSPTGTSFPTLFETEEDISDFYGTRVRGYLHPLETGLYQFWIASDNQGALYLSTTANPSDATLIASVPDWTRSREWGKFPEQQSAEVVLEAGQIYYIEALQKEGGGGDHLAVAWSTPSRNREVIQGQFLSPFNGAPAIGQPADRTDPVGATVSLAIQAGDPENDPITYGASGLPDGLSVNPSTGLISGTLEETGTFNVSISASDGVGTATSGFVWTVTSDAPPLEIIAVDAPPVEVGTEATLELTVSGPQGITVDWDFGDGASATGAPSTTHTWATAGRFEVTAVARVGAEVQQINFFQNVFEPVLAGQASQSSTIAVDVLGRVWNVNPDNNSVTVTSPGLLTRLAEIPVGEEPTSLAIHDGSVLVVNKRSASVSVISESSLIRQADLDLPFASQPHGIVVAGGQAFVTLEATGRIARLDPATGSVLLSEDLGAWIRHLAVSADGAELWVTRFITPPVAGESTASVSTEGGGDVIVLRTSDLGIERTVKLAYNNTTDTPDSARGVANYLGTPALSPDGLRTWIPSKFDNIFRGTLRDGRAREHDRLVRGGLSVISRTTGSEEVSERLDIDDQSHPAASVFGPRGNVLFVAHPGSRTVSVIDPIVGQPLTRISTGRTPAGLALSADGRTLYVHNYLDRTVQVIDVSAFTLGGAGIQFTDRGTVETVSVEALLATILRGKQLFNDALDDRLSAQDYLSCSSCHDGGSHDGRVWDFTDAGEGLRNTIDLRGRGGTDHGPVHWTANFDEIHDFEGDIRNVFNGTGLMSNADFAATSDPLGPLKAGRSEDLDALAAYVASLTDAGPSPFRNANGSLSSEALVGRDVFQQADCAACHAGSRFTDSPTLALHDIGTLRASSGGRLGETLTGIDTPTLRGVWAGAPYLHDGSALTLRDAVLAHDTVTLSEAEITSLVAYLQAIDDEEANAPTAGQPPSISAVPEQVSQLLAPVTLQLSATEPDGDPVTFTANGLPDGLSITSDGLISGSPSTSAVFQVTARATDQDGSDAVQFVWRVLPPDTPQVYSCLLVADNDVNPDQLVLFADGVETLIGETGTSDIEGMAWNPLTAQAYAADGDRFGVLDTQTGAFSFVGRFGSADGALGNGRSISDVDAMTVDPVTGVVYALTLKYDEQDLLVTINPATGAVVPDFFGAGADYVAVQAIGGVQNIDDIAIDPATGTMFAVGTNDGTRLFTIDKTTGATTLVGSVPQEIEGLAFRPDGRLLGTTGDYDRRVVEIDPATGATEVLAQLSVGFDYEGIDCRGPSATLTFAGRVFEDLDEDGAFGQGDQGFARARVDVFSDTDADGAITGTDQYLRSVSTDTQGAFSVLLPELGSYAARVDYSSLPATATPVTPNLATATFVSDGQADLDNLFPFMVDRTDSNLFCYLVADEGSGLGDGDVLTRINKGSFIEASVGTTGTQFIEALAFNPQQTTLYAASGRRFGTVDTITGAFTEIGTFGNGQGAAGGVSFSDVDGLAFDPNTGILYGAVRRLGSPDVLIQIDPGSGSAIGGAFDGADYVEIEAHDGRLDVDDLAISPIDGELYGILNADSGRGRLITIDRRTGASVVVRELDDESLEGLTFDGDGTLIATRGSSFQEAVVLALPSGQTTLYAPLGTDGHQDYEAIACLTNQTNTTAGRVYADMNASGGFDEQDAVLPDVEVGLYRDANSNGSIDRDEVILISTRTDFDGRYAFRTASRGDFLVAPVANDYFSASGALRVSYTEFGMTSEGNDFVVEISTSTPTESEPEIPDGFSLDAAYPNPFNPVTTIGYELPRSVQVSLEVFDISGRRVKLLAEGVQPAGVHRVQFDASRLPSGVYFYRLLAGDFGVTRSVVLIK
ncbi:MAG: DUF1929 domain-containing protein [Rhodothermales bacterium]|nr:DUF1929 domain-containing protein [Rhodothermales bacterium]